MPASPNSSNVGGIIITFNPDERFNERVAAIAEQVTRLIIVDNASTRPLVLGQAFAEGRITIIQNNMNLGVATALNQGVRQLQRERFEWALTFDQDTLIEPTFVNEMVLLFSAYPDREKLAVIGAGYCAENEFYENGIVRGSYTEQKTVITSGSLVSIAAYNCIGGFLEALFIDHVDHEFCLSAWSNGYKVIRGRVPIMRHVIGKEKSFGFRKLSFTVSIHPPIRYYYRYRNPFILLRRHIMCHPSWLVKMILKKTIILIPIIVLSSDRLAIMSNAFRGFVDGVKSRSSVPKAS